MYMLTMLFVHSIRCMYVGICAVICKYVMPPPWLCFFFQISLMRDILTYMNCRISSICFTYLYCEILIFKRVEQNVIFNALQMYNSLFVFLERYFVIEHDFGCH